MVYIYYSKDVDLSLYVFLKSRIDWHITKCHFIRRQTEISQPEQFLLIKWSWEISGSLIILYVGNRQWNLYWKILYDRNVLNLVRDNTATVIYCLIFIIATVDSPTQTCCFSSSQGLNDFLSNAFEDFISLYFFFYLFFLARKIQYLSISYVNFANSQPNFSHTKDMTCYRVTRSHRFQ